MKTGLLLMLTAMAVLNPSKPHAVELTALSPGINEVQIQHNGHSRRLLVTTPETYDPQSTYPILMCFHGAGGKADGQSNRWSPQADKNGLIVICAEAIQPQSKWNFKDNFHAEEYDDVGFISRVVGILIENKIGDETAIYATGHSSGGLFTYRAGPRDRLLSCNSPDELWYGKRRTRSTRKHQTDPRLPGHWRSGQKL